MSNLAIWDLVSKTDPDMTEKVNFGAFKFTTIDSMYQIQQATKVFGPCGQGWGTRNERFTPIVADPADPHYTLLCYQAEFWYIYGGKEGKQEIAADIELFEHTKNGWKRVSDPVKKVRTAGLSKGLSWLGFSADVFLGKFDDARYVQALRQEKQEEARKPKATPTAKPMTDEQDALIKSMVKQLGIPSGQVSDAVRARYSVGYKSLSEAQAEDFLLYLSDKAGDLMQPEPEDTAADHAEAGAYEGVSA